MAADSIAKQRYEKEELTVFILSSTFKLLSQNFSYNPEVTFEIVLFIFYAIITSGIGRKGNDMKRLLALGLSAAFIGFTDIAVNDADAASHHYYRGGGVHHGGYHPGGRDYYQHGVLPLVGAVVYGGAIAYPYRHYGYGRSYGHCQVNYQGYMYRGSLADDGLCYVYLYGRWMTFDRFY
jgi:hypothetical protein